MAALAGLMLVLLAVGGLAGCGSDKAADDPGNQTSPDMPGGITGESKDVKVDEEFEIELESNPSTGYEWKMTTAPDESILSLSGDEFIPADTDAVGAPGSHVWKFKALKDGRTNMVFEYARSWETDVPPEKVHNVSVTVQ
jgi:predicted secreted protein